MSSVRSERRSETERIETEPLLEPRKAAGVIASQYRRA
jgi:hypothetical protein